MTPTTVVRAFLAIVPGATGYAMSAVCPMRSGASGGSVAFRPPPLTFAIVWPILYVLLGISWFRVAGKTGVLGAASAAHLAVVLVLNAWIWVYSCREDKRNAVFVLLASVLVTGTAMLLSGLVETLLLLPLLVWLNFATLMNATEVQGGSPAGGACADSRWKAAPGPAPAHAASAAVAAVAPSPTAAETPAAVDGIPSALFA